MASFKHRFNNLATLMIHSDRTANIDLDEVASEFASRNDNRKRNFGIKMCRIDFIVHLACICKRVSMYNFHMHGGAKEYYIYYNLIEYKNLPPDFMIPSAGPAGEPLPSSNLRFILCKM